MRLTIRSVQVALTDELRGLVDRRMQFALSRFEHQIDSVRVTLRDLNGPRQGVDQECRVLVQMTDGHQIIIREVQASGPASIARAADRVVQSLGRVIQKRRRYEHAPLV